MTQFLFDENLPQSLLIALGVLGAHTTSLGQRMTDHSIWAYAREHGFVIVTKDADYFDRLALEGAPPKVVWIRTGNLRLAAQEAEFRRWWPTITRLIDTEDLVILHSDRVEAMRFPRPTS